MLSTLIETRQKISVYVKELGTAIRSRSLRPEDIQVGVRGVHRTQRETQDYLKDSEKGRSLGVSHLL